jgi:hypothetical protein
MNDPGRQASHLEMGRAAILKGDWKGAAQSARRSLAHAETAEGHELLGLASWWLSDAETLFNSRERAYRLYLDRGEVRRAARTATWLDWDCRAFRGEPAVANGWLRRARRLLEGDHDCAEYGWLLLREADARLSRDTPAAATGAAEAAALGRRHRDPDLEYIALSLEGLARVAAGSVAEGMQQLDEATAAVVAGEFVDRSAAGVTLPPDQRLRTGAGLRPRRPVVRSGPRILPPLGSPAALRGVPHPVHRGAGLERRLGRRRDRTGLRRR